MMRRAIQTLVGCGLALFSHQAVACDGRPFGQPTLTLNAPSLALSYSGTLAHDYIPARVTFPTGFNGICTLVIEVSTAQWPMVSTLENVQAPQHALTFYLPPLFEWNGGSYNQWVYGGSGQVVDAAIPFTIPANQSNKPAGLYRRDMNVKLKNVIRGGYYYDGYLTLTATVASSCTLPPPTLSALDFTPAIVNGTIPAAYLRSFSLPNAGCNGPARLTLSAQPLTRPGGGTPIHFSASAVLGSTAVSLDTRVAASSFATAISAPVSSSVPVTVTVAPTITPLQAGAYSSNLRVSLEPAQ